MKLLVILITMFAFLAHDCAMAAEIRIGRLAPDASMFMDNYPGALQSLLRHVKANCLANVAPEPILISSFEDEKLLELPFVYANFADRKDWNFTRKEADMLRKFFKRGGLLFIDAGITAEFLRTNKRLGQHHSYAEWDASPELKNAFKNVFPNDDFTPLKRSDPLFKAFYRGLPDPSLLPVTVKDYTVNEKWPDGTYSTVVLKLHGRVAVMTTPIIAMGWGRNALGQWSTHIRFRILEDTQGLTQYLSNASYSGERFEVTREDGGKDVVYCQSQATPSWAHEPSGKTRMFRYYGSPEINDFAHAFYTRLGTNIIIHALTRP